LETVQCDDSDCMDPVPDDQSSEKDFNENLWHCDGTESGENNGDTGLAKTLYDLF